MMRKSFKRRDEVNMEQDDKRQCGLEDGQNFSGKTLMPSSRLTQLNDNSGDEPSVYQRTLPSENPLDFKKLYGYL